MKILDTDTIGDWDQVEIGQYIYWPLDKCYILETRLEAECLMTIATYPIWQMTSRKASDADRWMPLGPRSKHRPY